MRKLWHLQAPKVAQAEEVLRECRVNMTPTTFIHVLPVHRLWVILLAAGNGDRTRCPISDLSSSPGPLIVKITPHTHTHLHTLTVTFNNPVGRRQEGQSQRRSDDGSRGQRWRGRLESALLLTLSMGGRGQGAKKCRWPCDSTASRCPPCL